MDEQDRQDKSEKAEPLSSSCPSCSSMLNKIDGNATAENLESDSRFLI